MAIIEPQLVKRVNMRLVALVAFLLLVGLFVQYSASRNVTADSFHYIKRQLVWILAGLGGAVLAFRFDYRLLRAYTAHAYCLAVGSLLLLLIAGQRSGGAQSWNRFGGVQLSRPNLPKSPFIVLGISWKHRKAISKGGAICGRCWPMRQCRCCS